MLVFRGYPRQNDSNGKGGLGLLAIVDQAVPDRRRAWLGDIPGCARLRMLRVAHVGCRLVVDRDGPDGDQTGVQDEGEEWMENVADEHDALEQEEEDGEHGDDDVPVCGTRTCSVSRSFRRDWRGGVGDVQLLPWQRSLDGPVVGDCVDELIGITVPPVIGPLLPETRAVEIRRRDAKERESGDG